MIVKSFITLITIFVIGSLQAQTTYYVDATTGNDTNLGTTQILAWKTIQKVENMSVNFQPGDSILFKKGEVWNGEQLKPSNHPDGTINNPITYASYGAGAKPIINLHIEQSPVWTDKGNNIYIPSFYLPYDLVVYPDVFLAKPQETSFVPRNLMRKLKKLKEEKSVQKEMYSMWSSALWAGDKKIPDSNTLLI